MAGRHIARNESIFSRMSRKQWMVVIAIIAAIAMVTTCGAIVFKMGQKSAAATAHITEYSVNDLKNGSQDVSRDNIREALSQGRNGAGKNTTYIRVTVNGKSRLVVGNRFTTVKSVLQAGNITLNANDTVSPSLNSKVTESTVIKISSPNSEIQTIEESIPFNVIKKNDSSLPIGTTKVQTEGKTGTMTYTNLVTKNGTKTLSTNTISQYVKTAPVNKVILVGTKKPVKSTKSSNTGTGSSSSSSSRSSNSSSSSTPNYGTTMPVGQAQSYAHSQVLARGWNESQFTCLVQLWQRESGWSTTAANPSGAYGIPQALPGSKMGAGWQSDSRVQINWGLNYIAGRYSTPCGAWAHSNSSGWY
ncbi:Membrane-bound transglycosylase [Scardovia inopinata]|uniref:G5 domain-containing protein n=1 Tax=Scardovia inopinata F0304 TaxID=641146 RepID=W5IH80_SCAIO|nr:G5 domain-containing protein [Scardovia inopinata]EFG26200.2 hypothetical protein HMPREF9020_01281 [Scardovia inopinata F0304]SUV51241.1 Membrane-bound transglycosylase [Scardovia inopinata]